MIKSKSKRLLGIDYGAKRVGVALTDESGYFALPFCVLANSSIDNLVKQISKICQEQGVAGVVIGESRSLAGKSNPIMLEIERFKQKLEKTLSTPIDYELEWFTSVEARRLQGETDENDASAAALILKSYIDRRH